jgi:hypothetical protein
MFPECFLAFCIKLESDEMWDEQDGFLMTCLRGFA